MTKPHIYDSEENTRTQFDQYGREIPDNRPLELLLTLQNAVKTQDQILKEKVAREFNRLARARGVETIEESNDFDMGDEDSAELSGYEFDDLGLELGDPTPKPDNQPVSTPAPTSAPASTPAPVPEVKP